jgi:hypothetical protein
VDALARHCLLNFPLFYALLSEGSNLVNSANCEREALKFVAHGQI